MSEIRKSTDYKVFKKLCGNREINKKNLNNIVESVQKQNNLNLHPIIVNSDMYVIDGQHRLEAAKLLNLPVYYVISKNNDENKAYEHIISANVNQKKWSLEDFFNLYANKYRNPYYREFLKIMDNLKLRPKGVIGLIFGPQNGRLIETMKKGEMKLPENREQMLHVCNSYLWFKDFVQQRKIKPFSMFTTHHFCYAFRMLCMNESCDIKQFFGKLENRWFELKPMATSKDWFNLLIGIYNWKSVNKLEKIDNVA